MKIPEYIKMTILFIVTFVVSNAYLIVGLCFFYTGEYFLHILYFCIIIANSYLLYAYLEYLHEERVWLYEKESY
jgi:hypothetical protein